MEIYNNLELAKATIVVTADELDDLKHACGIAKQYWRGKSVGEEDTSKADIDLQISHDFERYETDLWKAVKPQWDAENAKNEQIKLED